MGGVHSVNRTTETEQGLYWHKTLQMILHNCMEALPQLQHLLLNFVPSLSYTMEVKRVRHLLTHVSILHCCDKYFCFSAVNPLVIVRWIAQFMSFYRSCSMPSCRRLNTTYHATMQRVTRAGLYPQYRGRPRVGKICCIDTG